MRLQTFKNNKLYWGDNSVERLAEVYGTPLFVYDEQIIIDSIKSIQAGPWEIHYALKANPAPEILKTLLRHNIGIDAVSANEVDYAISLGFDPEKIVYTSSSLSESEVLRVRSKNVLVNVNSLSEIELYGKISPGTKIGIRINPEVVGGHHVHAQTAGEFSKFGIHIKDVTQAIELAEKFSLKISMVHFHIGSGILDQKIFIDAFGNILNILKSVILPDLEFINLGGGFGTPYKPSETPIDLASLINQVKQLHTSHIEDTGQMTKLVIEPGRYLVNEAGILLVRVNSITRDEKTTFYRTDSGFNHLVRPAMYGSYHHFVNASKETGQVEKVIVSGNICEGGDKFNDLPRIVTEANKGDIIAILDVGAYGIAMSMELYNLRGLPAEIYITKTGDITEIAKAQELKDIVGRYLSAQS